PPERTGSRLLRLDRATGEVVHDRFRSLPACLCAGDLLVLNDTGVLSARVELRRESGGVVRGLLLEPPGKTEFTMMLEGRGRVAAGDRLLFGAGLSLTLVESRGGGFWLVSVESVQHGEALLESGRMPLPPYIRRERGADPLDGEDRERYQTVFAAKPGAVAAPTAGLHFTQGLLRELQDRQVRIAHITLHVGPGTFLPVRSRDLRHHEMHAERFEIPLETARAIAEARQEGSRVIAVGTTVVRTLESAASPEGVRPGDGETSLFIRPPYGFRVVDGLLTNFHLPESTLLMLVAALAGKDQVLSAYREAVLEEYRFFSYGDAMLIT
ncbi:MAG: tRNA preQ1(34) S-adenosylmethionine ribosyltransferase-isomerase QueA, partial [Planctomycetota bacterium]